MNRGFVAVSLVGLLTIVGAPAMADEAPDSAETLREQQLALESERSPRPDRTPSFESVRGIPAGGLLFIGVDDPTVSTYTVDPTDGTATPAFTGTDVWGAAVISGASPGDAEVYFNESGNLWRWQDGSAPAQCCSMTLGGASTSVVAMAYDPAAGKLLFTRNIGDEGVLSLAVTPGSCPASCELVQEWLFSATANVDAGGIAWDPVAGVLYATNDDTTPASGIYILNSDSTETFVAPYPVGQTDIDGLAWGGGKLYLVTDEPGSTYVYDIATAMYETPIPNPWTTAEVFSGAGYGDNILIPVELQSFGVE